MKYLTHWKAALIILVLLSLLIVSAFIAGWTLNDLVYLPRFLYLVAMTTSPLTYLKIIFDSQFFAALLGALVGSGSAYIFARRANRFDDTEREIRFSNEGAIVAAVIANTARNHMIQHVRSLKSNFDERVAALADFKRRAAEGLRLPGEQYHLAEDYGSLPRFVAPVSILQKACEHTSLDGKVLAMAYALIQSIEQLNDLISFRSTLSQERKQMRDLTAEERIALYLGHEHEGKTNSENKDTIAGIYLNTRHCLFFSIKVSQAFTEHGRKLKGGRAKFPAVKAGNFERLAAEGMIPPDVDYQDWLR